MDHTPRLVGVVTTALLLGVTGAALAAPTSRHSTRPRVRAPQQLVMLDRAKQALSRPRHGSGVVATVSQAGPITGEQTVLPVLGHATDRHGTAWLQVRLPGRPNSHTGWISTSSTTRTITRWEITINLSARRVTALRDGHQVRTFSAVVGKPSTPTPTGRFYVEETVQLGASQVGAPYALATSARSNVLQQFDGGPGQIALHGTDNVGGVPGTAASHGCIRLDTRDITWLATRIGPGTPITITG
jgi:lipoprotein-anchoring transpeptidase ErfK/SrfK